MRARISAEEGERERQRAGGVVIKGREEERGESGQTDK